MSTVTPVFQPVVRAPLSVLVSRRLRDAIVSGDLPIGTALPPEKELAERFGVSRPTIREAIRVLQTQGLVSGGDTVSTARPRVTDELTATAAGEALENVLRLGRVPLPDLIELRLLLEGAALATVVPSEGLPEACRELGLMRQPGIALADFHDADVRFHLALASAGANRAIPLVMNVLRHGIAVHLLESLQAIADVASTLDRLTAEHAAILAAVQAADGELACRLLRSHVEGFYAEHGIPHG